MSRYINKSCQTVAAKTVYLGGFGVIARLFVFYHVYFYSYPQIGPVTNDFPGLPDPLFDHHRYQRRRPRDASDSEREAETNRLVYAKLNYMVNVITSLFPNEIFEARPMNTMCLKIIVMELLLKV